MSDDEFKFLTFSATHLNGNKDEDYMIFMIVPKFKKSSSKPSTTGI